MQWVEGNNIFKQNSKSSGVREEIDLVRMGILLLKELQVLHQANYFHCDIKPQNIMIFKYFGKNFFMFVDYGSAFKEGEEGKRITTYSEGYTPEDQFWNSKSDLYSLGLFFYYFYFNIYFYFCLFIYFYLFLFIFFLIFYFYFIFIDFYLFLFYFY